MNEPTTKAFAAVAEVNDEAGDGLATPPIHPLEWLGVALALVGAFAVAAMVAVVPAYIQTYAEFGSELPGVTRLVAQLWVPALLALVPLLLLVGAMVVRKKAVVRRALIGTSIAVAGLAFAFLWWALTLPLTELADNIAQ